MKRLTSPVALGVMIGALTYSLPAHAFFGALFGALGGLFGGGAAASLAVGVGTTIAGQALAGRQERRRIRAQTQALQATQRQEQQAVRQNLRSGSNQSGSGSFASDLSGLRRFTGFGA